MEGTKEGAITAPSPPAVFHLYIREEQAHLSDEVTENISSHSPQELLFTAAHASVVLLCSLKYFSARVLA